MLNVSIMKKEVESKATTAVVRVYSQELVIAFTGFMATLMDNVDVSNKVNENGCTVFVIFEKNDNVHSDWSLTMVANRNTGLVLDGDLTFMGVEEIKITPIFKYEDIVDFVKAYTNLLLDVVKRYKARTSNKGAMVAVKYWYYTRRELIAHCRKIMREAANDVEYKAAVKEVEAALEKTANGIKVMTTTNKLNS